MREALDAISTVLNAVERRCADGETSYKIAATGDAAIDLLHVLYRGIRAEEAWQEKIQGGVFDDDDEIPPDL